jgi:LysM repeat protein
LQLWGLKHWYNPASREPAKKHMTNEPSTSPTKLCPTCGTRVNADATRCLVCGADLGTAEKPAQPAKVVQGSRMPEVTLSLPIAILLLAVFLVIGAVLVYFAVKSTPEVIIPPTITSTITITVTPTNTATEQPPTNTATLEPSPTPGTYLVQENDTCLGIAAFFGVSVQSIVTLNNLPSTCDNLYIGQPLMIPAPTATPSPQPSATFSLAEQTEAACEKVDYEVKENDTLGAIASAYGIPMAELQEYNGLPSETVYIGQNITIPLCKRFATPGPTPTPTPPPPYPGANLLLPADGTAFTLANDSVTLQWASVGTLRENEAYVVIVEDVTLADGTKVVDYVVDTKYNVPVTLRPKDNTPHIFRWKVSVARQTSTDDNGNPIWESAGAESAQRVFSWAGTPGAATPTP